MPRPAALMLLAALATQTPSAVADGNAVDDWCTSLGERLASISAEDCRARNFVAAPERTAGENALVFLDVEPLCSDDACDVARRVLVVGGIHGDELTAVSLVFRWLERIGQPNAAGYHWRVIPVANPDGLLARPSTRVNGNGVDINRNFQTPDWDRDALEYWTRRTRRDPRRFPGQSAGSEVETRWLQAQVEAFKPDLIISLHAPYNLLDYDGPVPTPLRFGQLALNRLGVYPGSMGNYCGLFKQIPVITIELPNATVMPTQREQLALWEDMLAWMKENLSGVARPETDTGKRLAASGEVRAKDAVVATPLQ